MEGLLFVVVIFIIALAAYATAAIHERSNFREQDTRIDLLNQTVGELQNKSHELVSTLEEKQQLVEKLSRRVEEEAEKNRKILSQKKSSETRLGQISEQLAPFLKDCPYDPKQMHFVGQPIDFLIYDYDNGEIIFLEVKSGNAKESTRQKTIKNMVKAGRVFYERMRISDKGVTIKRESNNEVPNG